MLNKKSILSMLLDFLELAFISTAVILLVFIFVGQLLQINGDSMYPTFKNNEQLVLEKLSIKFSSPKRGEIVIFRNPKTPDVLVIKRVIGLPGETFELSNGAVYINGDALDEPYLAKDIKTTTGRTFEEGQVYTIPQDSYVVLGDNRTMSTDSREWGFLNSSFIVGRVLFVYYPLKNFRFGN
jgi:signal peptidase I